MDLLCAERERLWAVYDSALRSYAEAVSELMQGDKQLHRCSVERARQDLDVCHTAIQEHCLTHGCDHHRLTFSAAH